MKKFTFFVLVFVFFAMSLLTIPAAGQEISDPPATPTATPTHDHEATVDAAHEATRLAALTQTAAYIEPEITQTPLPTYDPYPPSDVGVADVDASGGDVNPFVMLLLASAAAGAVWTFRNLGPRS